MQSILDEIKATAVYQLFRSRLYALLLFPKAMSEAGPREIGKETSGEVNNNASKSMCNAVPSIDYRSLKNETQFIALFH